MQILVLDDEKGFRDELKEYLDECKYKTFPASKPSEAFAILKSHPIDIAILDIRLPEMDGLSVLKKMKKSFPDVEAVVISGHGDMDSVIQAIKLGAIDYFNKPFKLSDMLKTINKTKNYVHLNRKLKVASNGYSLITKELEEKIGFAFISGNSLMKTVLRLMYSVAKSDHTSVLITGESGTGKELIARGIHYLSDRANKPFLPVNCSTVSSELFESEFFGHKRGAFTGAMYDKKGLFEVAEKGTLFLDEIADLDINNQPKFLRVLDNKLISRLGDTTGKSVDVRIVAATNFDLLDLVEKKQFRLDLFHRLNSFVIHLPPLRERKDDIPLLTDHFIKMYSDMMNKKIHRVDKNVVEHLIHYDFPGNVRELKHMIENAVILCNGDTLRINHFESLKKYLHSTLDIDGPANPTFNLELIERNTISLALQKSDYNKSKAAGLLEISRQALDRKLKKWNIDIHKSVIVL
jgi:DNA-binding NtrC family response regulator